MKLSDPTPASEIKTRQGPGGKQLSYVDARFVMERLDESVGPENWQDRYEDRTDGSVRCGIGILFNHQWVWKWDAGDPSDIEATKGVHSDAFKRAGVKWGIARDLYGDHALAAQKPAPRPAAVPDESYPWDEASSLVEQAQAIFPDAVPVDECPDHHKPFKYNARGGYCPTKLADGTWCKRRPAKVA